MSYDSEPNPGPPFKQYITVPSSFSTVPDSLFFTILKTALLLNSYVPVALAVDFPFKLKYIEPVAPLDILKPKSNVITVIKLTIIDLILILCFIFYTPFLLYFSL